MNPNNNDIIYLTSCRTEKNQKNKKFAHTKKTRQFAALMNIRQITNWNKNQPINTKGNLHSCMNQLIVCATLNNLAPKCCHARSHDLKE